MSVYSDDETDSVKLQNLGQLCFDLGSVYLSVKDYAKYMVAAESTTMGTGMYYLSWLDFMGANSSASGSEYCEYLVAEYMDSLEGYDYKASMSYVKLSKPYSLNAL